MRLKRDAIALQLKTPPFGVGVSARQLLRGHNSADNLGRGSPHESTP
ncbi:hypothetical protein [Pyrobaculum islandicum]|nr:hypothetical protein [Pyrobaculum islandicum]